MINASPDLAQQIEATPELRPRPDEPRNSPIAGVLLTNADIDHALGLVLMRQRQTPLTIHATKETRAALAWLDAVLNRFCGIEWKEAGADFSSLGSDIAFRSITLKNGAAFQLRDEISGAMATIAPAVDEITDELRDAINSSSLILFDGTFWSDNELRAIRPGARSAREMNHLPINEGSLDFLRKSPARRKVYTHINNTNPILMPGSPERALVESAGIEIARDGMEVVP